MLYLNSTQLLYSLCFKEISPRSSDWKLWCPTRSNYSLLQWSQSKH